MNRLQPVTSLQSEQFARAAQIVGGSLDLDEVLNNALCLAIEAMHAERGFLMLAETRQTAALKDPSNGDQPLADDALARQVAERVLESRRGDLYDGRAADPNWAATASIVALHVRRWPACRCACANARSAPSTSTRA